MPEYGNWVQGADPPGGNRRSSRGRAEALAEVYTAARRLAQDAYTSRKPEAEELAERLLYEIHVGTCYASPTGVVLAAIWQTLLTGHLRRHLEPARGEPFDRKNLGDRMAEAVERLGAWNHPLGVVRRTGIWETTGHVDFMPRPGVLGIRQLDFTFPIPSWDVIANESGSPFRSADWQTAWFEWRVLGGDRQNGDHFEINFQRLMDAPSGTFEIFRGVMIRPGRYW